MTRTQLIEMLQSTQDRLRGRSDLAAICGYFMIIERTIDALKAQQLINDRFESEYFNLLSERIEQAEEKHRTAVGESE